MAKPKGVPALTAERTWKAIQDGSLVVEPVTGTRMLKVLKGRIRLTWEKDGQVKHDRFTIQSDYLNPRWVEVTKANKIRILAGQSQERLACQGILQTPEGGWYQLIYQQVEGIFHLDRQLNEHILPQYDVEEEKLWRLLDQVATQAAEDLRDLIDQRFQAIHAIRPHMAGRSEAAKLRLRVLKRRLNHIQGAIGTLLRQPVLAGETTGLSQKEIDGTLLGIRQALARHHQDLVRIREERPFSRRIQRAQHHLREAIAWLQIGDSFQAAKQLRKALPYLEWSEEEKGG